MFLTPVVLDFPAQEPAKKLSVPVPPLPEMQLVMLRVPHCTNTLVPPDNSVPFTYRPVALAHSLVVAPAAITTVQHIPAVPCAAADEPMKVLSNPDVTAQPARQPRNMFLQPVV